MVSAAIIAIHLSRTTLAVIYMAISMQASWQMLRVLWTP